MIIAGGATGIGATTARRLAREGAHVIVADINLAGADETAHSVQRGRAGHGADGELARVISDAERAAVLEKVRSPRLGRPEDLAAMVTMLMSDDGEWVNGQVLAVNGGTGLR